MTMDLFPTICSVKNDILQLRRSVLRSIGKHHVILDMCNTLGASQGKATKLWSAMPQLEAQQMTEQSVERSPPEVEELLPAQELPVQQKPKKRQVGHPSFGSDEGTKVVSGFELQEKCKQGSFSSNVFGK